MRYYLSLLLLMASFSAFAWDGCKDDWPLWKEFAQAYIQDDGRVIDYNAEAISTSEGQSYALFFSLAAQDRVRFDKILKWTADNLAHGNLSDYLPAWKWGKSPSGNWQILDSNSASDADIWIVYSLFQAAKVWDQPRYFDLARAMLKNIAKREVVDLPGLGAMLLPAPYGFSLDASNWRLNPSYMPLQVIRYFSKVDKSGPWGEILVNTKKMIVKTSSRGLVPDWVIYGVNRGFYPDKEKGDFTSYEAIRVYLWWAMLSKHDSMYSDIRPYVTGFASFEPNNVYLPERMNVHSGMEEGVAPMGFAAALAPYRFVQYGRSSAIPTTIGKSAGYYNFVLGLFGYGWLESRFQFETDGTLKFGVQRKCSK